MEPIKRFLRLHEVIGWGPDPIGLMSVYKEILESMCALSLSLSLFVQTEEKPGEDMVRRQLSPSLRRESSAETNPAES